MKELKSQLKRVKDIDGLVNPDRVWVAENKARLMSQIANTATPQKQVMQDHERVQYAWYSTQRMVKLFVPRNMARAVRPVMTVMLALLLTTSGWIASAYAQPGDTLWSAKAAVGTVIEKSQLAFADDEEDVKLNLTFAAKRAQEIKTVVEREDVAPEKKAKFVQKTSEDLEKNLDEASEGLKNTDSENTSVKEVSLKTKEIAKTLKETTEKVSEEVIDEELKKDLTEQTVETQKISLEMVETVVQKKVDAQVEITDEEKMVIKEHIEEVVETISEDTQKVKEQTDELVKDVEDAEDIIDEVEIENIEGVIEEVVSEETTTIEIVEEVDTTTSTPEVIIEEKTTQEQVQEVAEKVEEAIKTVDTEKQEVQTLVEEENILEAIKKTRALTETVEQTAEEVTRVSEDVMPVILNTGIREEVIDTKEDTIVEDNVVDTDATKAEGVENTDDTSVKRTN